MCAHGRKIGRSAEDAVHRPTDNESVAAAYAVLWYNLDVLSGIRRAIASCRKAVATAVRMSPIPIDRKRCKAIVRRNVGSFRIDDTVVEDCAHTRAPLSVFRFGHPTASSEIGERPFLFSDGCESCALDKE